VKEGKIETHLEKFKFGGCGKSSQTRSLWKSERIDPSACARVVYSDGVRVPEESLHDAPIRGLEGGG